MIDRAQASNVGVVLLLVLTVAGAGVVVAIGSSAYDDVQRQTSTDRAEHAMTLLDARAATVGLGEGSSQTVRLGRSSGGDYAVDSETGWLRITHANYTNTGTNTDPEIIYNDSLGSVTYRTGDTTIAYQGGGVWRQQGNGTTMVSPPEFHYRGTTLTLPIIRVRSDDAASGSATAIVRRDGDLRRIFPNETTTGGDGVGAPYDNGSDHRYLNPVRNGTVSVTVGSEYYRGWADYFRTRTTGNVSVDHTNRTATVVLETTSQVGQFTLPEKDEGVAVRGIGAGHSVTDFQTSIKKDNGTFNNLWASFYIDEGDTVYEAVIKIPNGIGNNYCDDGTPDAETLTMDIYYHDADTAEGVHQWSNDSIPSDSGPVQLACDGDDTVIEINFTSTEQSFTYGQSNIDEDTAIDWDDRNESATEKPDPTTFTHTGDDGENTRYNYSDTQNIRNLTRHYFAEFDSDFALRVSHGPGNRGTSQIDVSNSGGTIQYETPAGTSFITYLHVTENNVTVALS